MTNVLVVTHSPSPYQVELFDTVHELGRLNLKVVYLFKQDPLRHWTSRNIRHQHFFADSGSCPDFDHLESDLVVLNFYQHPLAAECLNMLKTTNKAWCFWGERPGFRAKGFVGRLYRRWKLRTLAKSQAPIWGIGSWAVDQYRTEFGHSRTYANMPYYSNLKRFASGAPSPDSTGSVRRFLFSGSLTERKGVDLLANAFLPVARQFPDARLTFLGSGPLETSLQHTLEPVISQVTFAGFQDWDQLPTQYHEADILVVPSRHDGWGLVVPEGLAAGLPVIASDRMGAALDLIQPGVNGWLPVAGDQNNLSHALLEAVNLDSGQFRKYQAAATSSVERHQLEDGAARFTDLCLDAIQYWPGDT